MLKVQTGMTGISVAAEILCVLAAWASNDPTFTECWDLPVFVFGYPLPTKVQDKPWFQWGGKRKQPDPTQDICRCFSAPSTAKVRKHHLTSVQLRYKQCWWPSTVVSMCGMQFLLKLEVGSKIQEFSKTTFHHPMTLSHFKTWLYVLNTLYMGGFHDYFGCFSVHGLLKRTLTLYSELPAVDATTGEGMDQIAILKRRFLFSQCQHSIIKDFKCEELGTYEYIWVLQHMAEWTRQEDR